MDVKSKIITQFIRDLSFENILTDKNVALGGRVNLIDKQGNVVFPNQSVQSVLRDDVAKIMDYLQFLQKNIEFIGRCGTYQYLDMHQVVNQSLLNVNRWIKDHE